MNVTGVALFVVLIFAMSSALVQARAARDGRLRPLLRRARTAGRGGNRGGGK